MKGFRFRFYPDKTQEKLLRQSLGCARFTYNYFLDLRQKFWYQEGKSINYYDTSKLLKELKTQPEYSWLKDVSSVVLQQSLIHLQEAYNGFFKKRGGFPTFKSKRGGGSITLTRSAFKYADGNIYIAKSKSPLKIRWSRQLPSGVYPNSLTITLTPSNRWYVSILCETEDQPLPEVNKGVGIDLGLETFVVTSDGEKIQHPILDAEYLKLTKLQRRHAKKQKGSRNREKARIKVARQYERITNIRKDFHHKLSSRLVSENQTICLETLNVKGMMKSSLARSIQNVSWSQFVEFLKYKCDDAGRNFVQIDQWYPSSKTCSNCGCITTNIPKGQKGLKVRYWECEHCGVEHDRDINAAKNILVVGTTMIASGDSVSLGEGQQSEKEESGKSLASR